MIGRLAAAQLWRIRWLLLILLFLGAMAAAGTSEPDSFATRLAMGWPLLSASSAITMLGIFWSRQVRVLPIPRRVALRAAWLTALTLPVVIATGRLMATIVKFAFDVSVTLSAEAIALAAVWDTTFIGISLTLMQLPDDPWESARQTFGSLRKSAKLVLTLVWMLAVPLAGPELVPRTMADVTWLHLAGVLGGIVITAWPLVTDPDQWPRLGVLHDAVRPPSAKPSRIQTEPRALDQLLGMRRLLPGPVATAALVAVLTLAASAALAYSLEGVQSLFSASMTDMEFFLIGGPFFLLILGPFGWASGLTPFLRSLKALPVTAMRIVVTMTALPLLIPTVFWLLLAGVHLAFGELGDTRWRLESFALLCGVMAFSGAVYARFNSVIVLLAGCGGPIIGLIPLMEFFDKAAMDSIIALWFPIVGLVGVPTAFLLNYRTVTRASSSSAAYRPVLGKSLHRGGV